MVVGWGFEHKLAMGGFLTQMRANVTQIRGWWAGGGILNTNARELHTN